MLDNKIHVILPRPESTWQAEYPEIDHRRFRRFGPQEVTVRVGMIDTRQPGLTLHPCRVTNLSYGGMCFSTDLALAEGEERRLLIDLADPFNDVVLVKARVVRAAADAEGRQQAAVEFVESSKGWFGPADELAA
jgi:hypothetical protein